MKKFVYKYNSLDEFLTTIVSKPINRQVFSNPSSISGDFAFTGTNSFKEAWELCRYTQDEGFSDFKEKFNYINFKTSPFYNKEKAYKCVGYAPNVGRFLNGYPNDMINTEMVQRKKGINVRMNCSYSAYESHNSIINRGVFVLNLIQYLEKKGFNVNFEFESVAKSSDEIIQIIIVLKQEHEKLNIKYCYFPIVNPSFLRRLLFRAKEIITNIGSHWAYGYGSPYIYKDEEINKLENTIYITTPNEMGIKGNDINEDFHNFISYIQKKYGKIINQQEKGDDENVKCR